MEIQKNISAILRKRCIEYRNLGEFAAVLGVGHTTLQNLLSGRGNPSADTIELVAKGLKITAAQLISGELIPVDRAFSIISGMADALHPTIREAAAIQMEALRQIFRLSEELCANDTRWRYTVTEPHPFHYALRASKQTVRGAAAGSAVSDTFTDDRQIAKAAAELFTRNSLSPIHLEEAIEDYMNSI